jgi:hypothetical protein
MHVRAPRPCRTQRLTQRLAQRLARVCFSLTKRVHHLPCTRHAALVSKTYLIASLPRCTHAHVHAGVSLLIEKKADVHHSDTSRFVVPAAEVTPLFVACTAGDHVTCVKRLLAAKADPDAATAVTRLTPLSTHTPVAAMATLACRMPWPLRCSGRLRTAAGAYFTCFHVRCAYAVVRRVAVGAAMEGHTESVRAMLDASANTALRSIDGLTAFHLATRAGHQLCASLLEKAMAAAGIRITSKADEQSPSHRSRRSTASRASFSAVVAGHGQQVPAAAGNISYVPPSRSPPRRLGQ